MHSDLVHSLHSTFFDHTLLTYLLKPSQYTHPLSARHIPDQVWYTNPVFSVALGGILPFGAVCIELFFVMSALWLHQVCTNNPTSLSLLNYRTTHQHTLLMYLSNPLWRYVFVMSALWLYQVGWCWYKWHHIILLIKLLYYCINTPSSSSSHTPSESTSHSPSYSYSTTHHHPHVLFSFVLSSRMLYATSVILRVWFSHSPSYSYATIHHSPHSLVSFPHVCCALYQLYFVFGFLTHSLTLPLTTSPLPSFRSFIFPFVLSSHPFYVWSWY